MVNPVNTPTITSVTPSSGTQGQTLGVSILGANFTGATSVNFGAGITVNGITVNSSTQITANISISSTATTGARNVSVTTPVGTGTGNGLFTVQTAAANPPTVTTATYQIISSTSAQLFGTVNPNGLSTTGWFQWGTTTSYGNTTSAEPLGSGTSVVQMLHTISGLSPNTTYYFRAVAQNSAGTSYGTNMSFTTPSPPVVPPTVTTEAATSVSSSSATLNGTVNPNGSPLTAWFEWGTTTSYGNTTSTIPYGGTGTSPIPLSWIISGLSPNTTYHFRAVAQNSAGTSYGTNRTFTTSGSAPTVTTATYQIISSTSAQLFGTVNPNGLSTTGWFQWGTTTAYGNTTSAESLGSGTSVVQMLHTIFGLSANTTYYFRAVAQNSAGTSYGTNMSFTTPSPPIVPPTVTTEPATSVSSSSATLNGTVNPNGSPLLRST